MTKAREVHFGTVYRPGDVEYDRWKTKTIKWMKEFINWISTPDWYCLYQDWVGADFNFDKLIPKLMRGKYGLGFHKTALMLFVDTSVHNSYDIPFLYEWEEKQDAKTGFCFKKITNVYDSSCNQEWVARLEGCVQIRGAPIEFISSEWVDLKSKPEFWRTWYLECFHSVFATAYDTFNGVNGLFGIGQRDVTNNPKTPKPLTK